MHLQKRRNHFPFRINTLFFIVFVMFSILIVRIGILQLIYGEEYSQEVAKTEAKTTEASVPRGEIKDRNHNVIVSNTPLLAITFTRESNMTQKEIFKTAEKLSHIIDFSTNKLTKPDLKDYWIYLHPKKEQKLITKKERQLVADRKLDEKKLYKRKLERITENDLKTITKQQKKILAIKIAMTSGYKNSSVIVKKDATQQEYAIVSENLENLPGVDVGTDWDRHYEYKDTFRTILGNITDSNEGLPRENLSYYLTRDYQLNDRVGKSYIEAQYESILRGQKKQIRNITDKQSRVISQELIKKGERGKDLILTIDILLQKDVDKIIEEELIRARSVSPLTDRAFVVMMNPNTGEILSMSGKQLVPNKNGKQELQDYSLGTFTSAYPVGSVVKGATIAAGLEERTIDQYTTFIDAPIRIKDTPVKKSWKDFGPVNATTALKVSSNVFMFRTGMLMAGANYVPEQPLAVSPSKLAETFAILRGYYAQFGLGVPTGIELPNEFKGITGNGTLPGNLLDLTIGQYDTYTALQLAQYASTVANGGYRLKPQIVKEIRKPANENNNSQEQILHSIETKIFNKINVSDSTLSLVKEGFRQVMQVHGGTGYSYFADAPYKPAGKTGTAETFYDGPKRNEFSKPLPTYNLTLIGYAPHDHPQVAFSVIIPWVTGEGNTPNYRIGRRILDKYFELQKKANIEGKNNTNERNSNSFDVTDFEQ